MKLHSPVLGGPSALVYAASDGRHRPASHPVYGGQRRHTIPPSWPMTPEEIRRRRHSRGISQGKLARLMRVAKPTVSRWESGAIRPSHEHAARLREVLG